MIIQSCDASTNYFYNTDDCSGTPNDTLHGVFHQNFCARSVRICSLYFFAFFFSFLVFWFVFVLALFLVDMTLVCFVCVCVIFVLHSVKCFHRRQIIQPLRCQLIQRQHQVLEMEMTQVTYKNSTLFFFIFLFFCFFVFI